MANRFIVRSGTTTPTADSLMENELGFNTSTKELYIGQDGTTPYVLISSSSILPISRGGTGQTTRAAALKTLLHIGTSTDLSSSIELGKYAWVSSATNTPIANSDGTVLNIISDGKIWNKTSNSIWQLAFTTSDETPWVRQAVTNDDFSDWCAILTKTNFLSYITGEQIFNSLDVNSSVPADTDLYVVGGKKISHAKLWEYVKEKTDGLYFRKGTDSIDFTIVGSKKTFDGTSSLSWTLAELGIMGANKQEGDTYYNLVTPDGATYVRTPVSGLLPYTSGLAGNGHGSLGWTDNYFATAFIDTIYGTAEKASQLETSRKIAISGVVTGEANFDGTSDINISTISSITYSTNEVDTGNKWIDGKPIYRVCIISSSSVVNSQGKVGTLPSSISTPVSIRAFVQDSGGVTWRPVPAAYHGDTTWTVNMYINGTDIYMSFGSSWAGTKKIVIIAEYTKP